MKTTLEKTCDHHEREKKRDYNYRVMNIDQGTFTPLVYTVFGNVGKEGEKFYKTLGLKISEKCNERYNEVMNWMRVKISFMCIKACIMCLRGSRSVGCKTDNYVPEDFSFDTNNANI